MPSPTVGWSPASGPFAAFVLVFGLVFIAATAPMGTPLAASEPTSFVLSDALEPCPVTGPALVSLPGGGFVGAWIEADALRIRRFDRHGAVRFRDPSPVATEAHDVAVAAAVTGAFAVAWREADRVRVWRFDRDGQGQGFESIPAPDGPGPVWLASSDTSFLVLWTEGHDESLVLTGLDLDTEAPLGPLGLQGDRPALLQAVAQPNGDVWVLYRVSVVVTPDPLIARGWRFPADAPDEPVPVFDHSGVRSHALAPDADGGAVMAWIGEPLEGPVSGSVDFSTAVRFQRYDSAGDPAGDPVEVVPDGPDGLFRSSLGLTLDAAGNLSLLWNGLGELPLLTSRLRSYGPDNRALGSVRPLFSDRLADFRECSADLSSPGVVSGPGELTIAHWRCQEPPPDTATEDLCRLRRLEGHRLRLASDRTLLLGDGRFRVTVDWEDPFNGGSGQGHAIQDTRDTGGFWFFDPANQELTVKVLDARTVNGHFWFFYGALSNVAYQITVTDQLTGDSRRYENPPRRFGSFADNFAFPAP